MPGVEENREAAKGGRIGSRVWDSAERKKKGENDRSKIVAKGGNGDPTADAAVKN